MAVDASEAAGGRIYVADAVGNCVQVAAAAATAAAATAAAAAATAAAAAAAGGGVDPD
jgi:hypothetical protein